MKKRAIGLAGVAWLACASSLVFAQEVQGRPVTAVRFEGLERVSERVVASQVEVQPGQPYQPRAVARDIRRLYELGYFTTIEADARLEDGQVVLTYVLEEKRFISQIRIAGNKKVRTRNIRAVLHGKEGGTFTEDMYDLERDAIVKLYQSKGFPNAAVDIVVEEAGPAQVRITYTITEGKRARVRSIRFEGNEAISARKLRKIMKTKRAKWFLGGRYDEAKFEADLATIVDEYGNRGYLEAEVAGTSFEYAPESKKTDITIRLAEGAQYHVQSLEVADNVVYDKDEILRIAKVHPGDVHNKGQVAKDAEFIEKGYFDSGYVTARVSPQVTLNREDKTTHIVHQVGEGDLKYVREIKITGNEVTKDEIVRRDVLQIPGERFDGTAVRGTQRLLDNTQYFDKLRLTYEPVLDSDRFVNLLVDVEEGKTGTFSFGGGYSTEEKFSGFVEVRRQNFDLFNWPTFSGGGQEFLAKLSIGDVRTQYNISFTNPEFTGYPVAVGFDLFDERYEYSEGTHYTERNRGGQLRTAKVLSPYMTVRSFLRYVETDISDFPFLRWSEVYRRRGGDTTISSIWGITRNTLDIYRDPSSGAKHDLSLEIAGLGGDNEFVKVEHDSSWYWSLTDDAKWILLVRTREGWATPYGSSEFVPLQDRFFAGGTATVRGYDSRDIGPKVRRYGFIGEKEAIGGELRLVNNLEVKYKLTDIVRLYAFVDAGGVWEEPSDFGLSDVRLSTGLGFGVDIPRMGPIRVDYGIPINPDEDQGNGRLHLMTGFRF